MTSLTETAAIGRDEAERLTQRIRLAATSARESVAKLHSLVEQAKVSGAWKVLDFRSWTEYLSDTLSDEPLRLSRADRQELVGYLAGEGMSVPAIAAVAGVADRTVQRDFRDVDQQVVTNVTTSDEVIDAEIVDEPRTITGLDGKTYQPRQVVIVADADTGEVLVTPSEPPKPRRRPITDSARDIGWEIRKAAEKLQRLTEDDRFSRNKEEVAAHTRGHIQFVIESCQGFLDDINQ